MSWTLILLAVLPIGLYSVLKKRTVPQSLWWLQPLLLFVGMAMLAAAIGSWVSGTFQIGGTLGLAATVVMIILIVGAAFDLKDKKPDGMAKSAFVLVPFLAMIASGPVADTVNSVTGSVADVGVTTVSNVTGG